MTRNGTVPNAAPPKFLHGEWESLLRGFSERFDLVYARPPLSLENIGGYIGHQYETFTHRWMNAAIASLRPAGTLAVCVSDALVGPILEAADTCGITRTHWIILSVDPREKLHLLIFVKPPLQVTTCNERRWPVGVCEDIWMSHGGLKHCLHSMLEIWTNSADFTCEIFCRDESFAASAAKLNRHVVCLTESDLAAKHLRDAVAKSTLTLVGAV